MLQNIKKSEKKVGFIFHHGWGYDNSYWENIVPLFVDYHCILCDAGYFKNNLSEPHEDMSDISWIAIGHSIGFIKLLEKTRTGKIKLSAIVGIQSFVNFLGNNPRLNKNRSMILEKMISAFKKSPIQVLQEFRKNCAFPNIKFKQINFDLLLQDLEMLKLNFSIPNDLNTLIIAGENDPIVDNSLINDNFLGDNGINNCRVKFINCNEHTLGYDNPKTVYECIMNFIENVIW